MDYRKLMFRNSAAAVAALTFSLQTLTPEYAHARGFGKEGTLEGSGVCIHLKQFDGSEQSMHRLKEAGIKIIRTDLFWDATEKKKGEYNWSRYDGVIQQWVDNGIRPLLILDYANPVYTGNADTHVPPRTPEQIDAYARWAAAAVKHFEKYDPIWEIWNEPDIPQFWTPKVNVDEYVNLARPACLAMRAAVPDATIIGPALAIAPMQENIDSQVFAKKVLSDKDLMQCVDAFSFHPYRKGAPETVLDNLPFYQSLIDYGRDRTGIVKPLAVSEWGYSTYRDGLRATLTEEAKAAYVVRQQLVALLAKFPLMVMYNWSDKGNNPFEKEHRFGLLAQNGEDKPASIALNVLTSELSGFTLEGRRGSPDGTFLLDFKNDSGQRKLVAWKIRGPGKLVLNTQVVPPSRTMDGQVVPMTETDGKLALFIGEEPVYLDLTDQPKVDVEIR